MRYEFLIGLRYTRAKRRNHFISFISLMSMAGIALGVAALIVVLSVMNGFQQVLRARILGVVSHVLLPSDGEKRDGAEGVGRMVKLQIDDQGPAPQLLEAYTRQ